MAMISRGFSGDVKTLQNFQMSERDYLAGISSLLMSILLILISQDIIRI
jgi:cobalt/nickel transport system permease protein